MDYRMYQKEKKFTELSVINEFKWILDSIVLGQKERNLN